MRSQEFAVTDENLELTVQCAQNLRVLEFKVRYARIQRAL